MPDDGEGQTLIMEACRKPSETYPLRIPLKVIGRASELKAEAIQTMIRQLLGVPPAGDEGFQSKANGPWLSLTFWVTLPDAEAEKPLREAIHKLPGVVMQL